MDNIVLLEAAMRQSTEQGKILIAVLVDFEAAFDNVDKTLLCRTLKNMDSPEGVIEILDNYLSDRHYKVRVHRECFNVYPVHKGLPQVSSLSLLLFTLFLSDLKFSSENACKAEFADDLLIWSSGSNTNDMATELNQMMKELWAFSMASGKLNAAAQLTW